MITVLGGYGFVGSEYVRHFYDSAVVNDKHDYNIYTNDVLYFISTTHNYHIFDHPHLDIDTNLHTLITVLENWRRFGGNGTFTFISSWFVYGNQEHQPVHESVHCNPKGFYSITKRAAEQLLISYCETYDLKYKILRLANVIGKRDPSASARKNALQYLINKMKNNEPIELYDGGDFYRDYIHVTDCARAINLCIEKGEDNTIYNIGNGVPVRFYDIINDAYALIGSKSEIINIEQKEFHAKVQTKSMYLDNTKLKLLGYNQLYSTQDMLKGMI